MFTRILPAVLSLCIAGPGCVWAQAAGAEQDGAAPRNLSGRVIRPLSPASPRSGEELLPLPYGSGFEQRQGATGSGAGQSSGNQGGGGRGGAGRGGR